MIFLTAFFDADNIEILKADKDRTFLNLLHMYLMALLIVPGMLYIIDADEELKKFEWDQQGWERPTEPITVDKEKLPTDWKTWGYLSRLLESSCNILTFKQIL